MAPGVDFGRKSLENRPGKTSSRTAFKYPILGPFFPGPGGDPGNAGDLLREVRGSTRDKPAQEEPGPAAQPGQENNCDEKDSNADWVPEGSLAGFFGCRETALELVSGADFWCKLMSRGSPGDLGGSRGRFPV